MTSHHDYFAAYEGPLQIDNLADYVSQKLGRPVRVVMADPGQDSICGVTFTIEREQGSNVEAIFLQKELSRLQQITTFLHEVAHIVRNDQRFGVTFEQFSARLRGEVVEWSGVLHPQYRLSILTDEDAEREEATEHLATIWATQLLHRSLTMQSDVTRQSSLTLN